MRGTVELISVIVFLFIGAGLRIWRLGEIQIFADESHTLWWSARSSLRWIATHVSSNDVCIPYSLYNKALLSTIGLSEWMMRWPAAASGIALLLLCYPLLKKSCGATFALLGLGFLSLSPYLIYLSREARPYAIIMALMTWAGIVLLLWRQDRKGNRLKLAAFLLALSVYFHPVTMPSAFSMWFYPLVVMRYDAADRGNCKDYLYATMIGMATTAVLLGPTALSWMDSVAGKASRGNMEISAAVDGLLLLHGLPVRVPIWGWALPVCVGFIGLFRKHRIEAVLLLILLLVQISAIQISQPLLVEIPWVWTRYWIHLFPLLLVGLLLGLRDLTPTFPRRHWFKQIAVVLLLCVYGAWHAVNGHYAIGQEKSYPNHPMLLMMPPQKRVLEDIAPAAAFYQRVIRPLADVRIIESPRVYTFPLYDLYSRLHGKRVYTAGMGEGMGQTVMEDHPGFDFSTAWDGSLNRSAIKTFWIHHKNIKEEIRWASHRAMQYPLVAGQLKVLAEFMLEASRADLLFGSQAALDDFAPGGGARLIFEDQWLKVFEL